MNSLRSFAKSCLHHAGLLDPLRDLRRDRRFRQLNEAKIRDWRSQGSPAPAPDLVKYDVVRDYARRHGTAVLIETGTFYGNAIFTLRREFREIHSIELARELYEQNVRELGHLPHIHLHFGDSAVVLPQLLATLKEPALFWLDGHFCAGPSARADTDTPISAELDHLLRQPPGRHVVLIDDARLFVGRDSYPGIPELREIIRRHRPGATFEVAEDIIRIVPV